MRGPFARADKGAKRMRSSTARTREGSTAVAVERGCLEADGRCLVTRPMKIAGKGG